MARTGLAALCFLLLALSACGDDDAQTPAGTGLPPDNDTPAALVTPVTPVPRPGGVPEPALAITQTTTLGRIERRAGEAPQAIMTRLLTGASCADGILTFSTSQETIYAPLDCGSFWDEQTTALFTNQQAAFVLEAAATRFRIFIETFDGAQAEFTVGGIWVQ